MLIISLKSRRNIISAHITYKTLVSTYKYLIAVKNIELLFHFLDKREKNS